jgi:predicted MFS family arabinose efflux permease
MISRVIEAPARETGFRQDVGEQPASWSGVLAMTLCVFALMVAVIQLSIALGSTLGGVLFDAKGYQTTFHAAIALLVACAGMTWLTARAHGATSQ